MSSKKHKENNKKNSFILGLYKKARAGQLKGFTGIDQPYEAPETSEIICKTLERSVEECVQQIVKVLRDNQILPSQPQVENWLLGLVQRNVKI